MSWQTWAPFQSSEVREICAHLTAAERDDTVRRGAQYGLWCLFTFALPMTIAMAGLVFRGRATPTWLLVAAGGLIVMHVFLIPSWRRSQLRFLKNTRWAREQRIGAPHAA